MVKSRQRESKNGIIIHTKINWTREIVVTAFSMIVWFYCIVVVLFFISALFNYNNPYINLIKTSFKMTNHNILTFMLLILLIWLSFYIGLSIWRIYNLKRFGFLNRRTQPTHTTKEELLNLGLMNEKDYQLLHQSRVVVFEKNPIKELRK